MLLIPLKVSYVQLHKPLYEPWEAGGDGPDGGSGGDEGSGGGGEPTGASSWLPAKLEDVKGKLTPYYKYIRVY